MKIIKYLFLVVALIVVAPTDVPAQIANTLVKSAGKEYLKQGIKKGAKRSVKSVIVKKTTKRIQREALEGALKNRASHSVAAIAKKDSKRMALQQFKRGELASTKQIAKKMSKSSVKKMEQKALQQYSKRTLEKEGRNLALHAQKRTALPFLKEIGEDGSRKLVKSGSELELISKTLNPRAAQEWRRVVGDNVAKDSRLLKDLTEHPHLRSYLAKNPTALENYHNCIDSKYRTDISFLRYTNYHADKAQGLVVRRSSKNRQLIHGRDLILKDQVGRTLIHEKNTNKFLGTIEGNAKNGYTIYVNEYEGTNPLMDICPLNNSTMVMGNNRFTFDKYGRVSRVTTTIDKKVHKAKRLQPHIELIKDYKTEFTTLGTPTSAHRKYDDIAGHLVPDSWGGPSCMHNIIPQNAKMNGKGIWIKGEKNGLSAARKGHSVTRDIEIHYDGIDSQRPSSFSVTQTVDNVFQVVDGHEMNKVHIDNPIVLK